MIAILIDPEMGVVIHMSDFEPGKSLDGIRSLLDCERVERVALMPGENMWCDEEGLLREPHRPLFQLGEATIAGRAIILGEDARGNHVSTRIDPARLPLRFRPDLCLVGWKHLDGSTVMETAFGPMPVFGTEPIFGPRPESPKPTQH